MARKNIAIIRKLVQSVDETEDRCWIWNGERDGGGYGHILVEGDRMELAHVVAYKMFIESIAEGMTVCHRCDNPLCCQPDHLYLRNVISGDL
jgi:hypothetical protein